LRNAFFNSNEIREQSMESFKYSVKIESSYFAAGTKRSAYIQEARKIHSFINSDKFRR